MLFFEQFGGDMFDLHATWTAKGAVYPIEDAVIRKGELCGTFVWGCWDLDGLAIAFTSTEFADTFWYSIPLGQGPCAVLWGQIAFLAPPRVPGVAEFQHAFACRTGFYEGVGSGFGTRCPFGAPTHTGCNI